MIIKKRIAAVPLVTCDPYFSVWSDADKLNEKDTVHWTSRTQALKGIVSIDGVKYSFMGTSDLEKAEQVSIDIRPTTTIYTFEAAKVRFIVRFTNPLILTEPDLVSRPVTYVDFNAESLDESEHNIEATITADENHCHVTDEACDMADGIYKRTFRFGSRENSETLWFKVGNFEVVPHSNCKV